MENQKRDFKGIWIPKDIWIDSRLNALEKIILVEIDSLDCADAGCWASNKYLADFCQCSERAVSRAISKLIELNYIVSASFDGRNRRLKSMIKMQVSVDNFASQHRQFGEADEPICLPINIDNNITNISNKKNKKKGFDLIISEYTSNEKLKTALIDFIEFRKAIKAPLTDKALTLSLNKLDKLANSDDDLKISIINQSIERGWRGLFEVKETVKPASSASDYDIQDISQFWK